MMYNVGERKEMTLTYCGVSGRYDTMYGTTAVHKFTDGDGSVLIWKTGSELYVQNEDEYERANRGDVFRIKGTVKGANNYKGVEQTILTRVNIVDVIEHETNEQRTERIVREQVATLDGNDFIWTIPYKRYKECYSDCETIYGSYNKHYRTIDIIVREGRLKPSGTRGMTYSTYCLENEKGETQRFYAVCEENALKRAKKETKDDSWVCKKIYSGYWM